eukprot:gnl/MRDRNA2_/MRDRNA2_57252_c0_seq2.p1 gnl/MRDRNA2_/MRDRNA2_57252_c0~~gnl/MRDRNA2_/MRDRNA2_57252_c0_seq2.p1  ORF type:complete len:280 (-),score=56.61 gnl/MRDRNA2_/MRDRNA2_57252_c0_seq2:80-859(-)
MHQTLFLDEIVTLSPGHICLRSCSACAAVCREWKRPAMQAANLACESKLAKIIPSFAARTQLQRALGNKTEEKAEAELGDAEDVSLAPPYQVLRWLSSASKRSGQMAMLQSWSVHRSIGAAMLEGDDVFAACKRTLLLAEETEGNTNNKEVELWMANVVEAVESSNFEDSIPAWMWLAERNFLSGGGVRWVFELAHFLSSGSLRPAKSLLKKFPSLQHEAQLYANTLKAHPAVGQYSKEQECMVIRETDVRRLLTQCGS